MARCCRRKNDRLCANTISRMSWTCVPDLNLERRVNRMLAPFTSPPSITATSVRCPQCGEQMYIKLVVPDPAFSTKEKHTFECGECGLVRAFTIKLPKRRNKARPRRERFFKAVTSFSRSAVPFLGLRVHQFYLEGWLAFALVVVLPTDDHSEPSVLGQGPPE